jgi:hypothetical protein
VLSLRLMLARRDHYGILRIYNGIEDTLELGTHANNLCAVAPALRRPRCPDYDRQKVFGIGVSRTGTTSLRTALQALGLSAVH